MSWNWELPEWPNFTWDQEKVNTALESVRDTENQATLEILDSGKHDQSALKKTAQIQEIQCSSEIEGVYYSKQDIEECFLNLLDSETPSNNLHGMVLIIRWNLLENATRESLITSFEYLFPSPNPNRVGRYRTDPIVVVSGRIDKYTIHFQGPPPDTLEDEMSRFLEFMQDPETLCGKNPASVLVSAIAHFWFETIHPFDDGNGRIGRELAVKLLKGRVPEITSLSKQILKHQKEYYNQFERHQKDTLDLTEYLLWFFQRYEDSIRSTVQLANHLLQVKEYRTKMEALSLDDKQITFLNAALDIDFNGNLNPRKYISISKVNKETAIDHLSQLEQHDLITKITEKPSYILNIQSKNS